MTLANHVLSAVVCFFPITSLATSAIFVVSEAQNSGSVTFKDNAPPATEQQRKDAQDYFAKAQHARQRMELLGKALRATAELQSALAKSTSSATTTNVLRKRINAWKTLRGQLGSVAGATVTIDDKSLAAYPKVTLDAAFAVANAGAVAPAAIPIDLQGLKQLASKTQEFLFQAYDLTTIDHGLSNIVLRTYPYFDLVGQPFVECDTVNTFARDIKCLPVHSKGVQTGATWMASKNVDLAEFCHTDKLESFSRDKYGKVEMYVRKQSLIRPQLGTQCWD